MFKKQHKFLVIKIGFWTHTKYGFKHYLWSSHLNMVCWKPIFLWKKKNTKTTRNEQKRHRLTKTKVIAKEKSQIIRHTKKYDQALKKAVSWNCLWIRLYHIFSRQRLQNSCYKYFQRIKRNYAKLKKNLWQWFNK